MRYDVDPIAMTTLPIFVLAALLAPSPQASDRQSVIGTWEGESKCTVADSPCHDEHVIYRFAADKSDPKSLKADAAKVVNGSEEFMGTLDCQQQDAELLCSGHTPKKDEWKFQISGEVMSGTLTIGTEKTLYRRVSVRRKPSSN
jgi:hypothetical protein